MSNSAPSFIRSQAVTFVRRLQEPRRFLQVIVGARQVGKTTLVDQVLSEMGTASIFVSADEPTLGDPTWLATQWERGRRLALERETGGAALALDEAQKIRGWSETVKRLWDEDSRRRVPLKVVLLGSAPLLMEKGLSDSLAGRFEVLHLPHWSFAEMKAAFGFTFDDFLYFGGYPGAAPLIADPARWRRYLLDVLIETTISRDGLLMTRVDKPALLRRRSSWVAAIRVRFSRIRRCWVSSRMRGTRRPSPATSSSSAERGCWSVSRSLRAM